MSQCVSYLFHCRTIFDCDAERRSLLESKLFLNEAFVKIVAILNITLTTVLVLTCSFMTVSITVALNANASNAVNFKSIPASRHHRTSIYHHMAESKGTR